MTTNADDARWLSQSQHLKIVVAAARIPGMSVTDIEGKALSPEGLSYYYHLVIPGDPLALVVLVHGMGSHAGHFQELVDRLVGVGFACALYDQRGHGRSDGKRGYISHFSELVYDLSCFVHFASTRCPEKLPLYLMAQSMGGLVALSYLLTHVTSVSGLVTLSAALEPTVRISNLTKKLGLFLARFFPTFAIKSGLPSEELTRDPAMQRASRDDPYGHDVLTLWAGREFKAQVEYINKLAGNLSIPALLLSGAQDRIVNPDGTRKLAMRMHSSECTCKIYPGMFHDLVTDVNREQVFHDVIEWLLGQTARQLSPEERRHMIALKQPFWKDADDRLQGAAR